MSALIDFVKKLNTRIEKNTVLSDLDSILKELQNFGIPMTKDLADQAKLAPFSSDYYNSLASHVYDQVKFPRKSQSLWLDLNQALLNVQANCAEVKRLAEEFLAEDTLRDAMTARGANLLRMASAMSFVSSYTLDAVDYALKMEAVKLGDSNDIPPAQAKYVEGGVERFARLLADCCLEPKKFNKLFSDIPDVYLSDKNMAAAAAMFKDTQLDPFDSIRGVSNWRGSPIYAIRMMWETWQASRFHAAKDRKKMMELRLIHLQNLQQGGSNPRLEKEIEGLQARINKIDRDIRKVEESLN